MIRVYKGFDFSIHSHEKIKYLKYHQLKKEFGINFQSNYGLGLFLESIDIYNINIDYETHIYLESKGTYNFYNVKVEIINNNLYQARVPISLDRNPEKLLAKFENNEDIDCYSDIVKINDTFFVSYLPLQNEYSEVNFYTVRQEPKYERTIVRQENTALIDSQDKLDYFIFNLEISDQQYKELDYKSVANIIPDQLNVISSNFGIKINILSEKIIFEKPREELQKLLKEVYDFDHFRDLEIYSSPDNNLDTVKVSQAAIIEDIIKQGEIAIQSFYDKNIPNTAENIFITAPTGSGKSLMFILPAIYLARKYPEAITIVITPIKSLMQDQVENYNQKTGLRNSAFINGDLSIIERKTIRDNIQNGDIDILYLSPELLVSKSDITDIIGDRIIGYVIIDEAHIVTTWGQGFRPDYWYLGEYLTKLRYASYNDNIPTFPIVAFTATAVYSPYTDEGMVEDICNSLGIAGAKKYLGKATREDIGYQVNSVSFDKLPYRSLDKYLFEKAVSTAIDVLNSHTKTLIYVPYKKHAWDLYYKIIEKDLKYRDKVGIYVSTGDKVEKKELVRDFKTGDKEIVIATKAFGMGIDIDDIQLVYHFAPTGTLCDYVQEVGRSARREGLKGNGRIYYVNEKKSLKYDNQLFGMSGVKEFEIFAIMDKILSYYNKFNKKNMVISVHDLASAFDPEFFEGYDESLVEAKIKTILMMIKKHFEQKVRSFPVFMAKPSSMFTKHYFSIKDLESFKKHSFYRFSKHIEDTIFELNIKRIWENNYDELSFGQFKYSIFSENSISDVNKRLRDFKKISEPYIHLSIDIKTSGMKVDDCISKVMNDFDFIYGLFSRNKINKETQKLQEIQEKLTNHYNDKIRAEMITNNLPAILNGLLDVEKTFNEKIQVLSYVKTKDAYRVVYSSLESAFRNLDNISRFIISKLKGRTTLYLSTKELKKIQPILTLMDLMGYANYFTTGGDSPEIQIRLNGVARFQRSLSEKEENVLWRKVQNRHYSSREIMEYFFDDLRNDAERRLFIEHYFIGKVDECKEIIEDIRENRILNLKEQDVLNHIKFGGVKVISLSKDRSKITILVSGEEKVIANNKDYFVED